MKVILSLSGGLDSTTLCGFYLEIGYQVIPIMFKYGSKHNKYENQAAYRITEHFKLVKSKLIELEFVNKFFTYYRGQSLNCELKIDVFI